MKFVESHLLGVRVNESGSETFLSIKDKSGETFDLVLYGVQRLTFNELRKQNIIEDVVHWNAVTLVDGLRDAAFYLMLGVAEKDCDVQLAHIAQAVVDRVTRGELELLEITAIFGAQVMASFTSMAVVRPVP